jgi:hypothetical protein
MRRTRLVSVLTAVATAASTTAAVAQPLDPYGDPAPAPDTKPAPPPADQPPGVTDRDPEMDEAVAAALVRRAKELIAVEAWADAQQLLGEAVVRSPDGAAATEARALLVDVNAKLGIQPAQAEPQPPQPPPDRVADPVVQQLDYERPEAPRGPSRGGRAFLGHSIVIGGVIGGFFGDVVTADIDGTEIDGDPEDTEDAGGIVGGVLLGAVGGLALGMGLRKNEWMTRDDVTVIDSFTAFGMVGSLSLGAVMDPAETEAYSMNAVIGTGAGLVTGLLVAKKHEISSRRMARVDLWAAAGALAPWLIFTAADGDHDGAQVAGVFSIAGLVGGAWLGFRVTRDWDGAPAYRDDAPPAVVRRGSDGAWSVGAPSLRPVNDPSLGPVLGRGAAVGLVGARW